MEREKKTSAENKRSSNCIISEAGVGCETDVLETQQQK